MRETTCKSAPEICQEIYGKLPIPNKMVFSSFHGNKCAGDPKYISLYLYETHPEIEQVWICQPLSEPFDLPSEVLQISFETDEAKYHLQSADVWIDSHSLFANVEKNNNQYYLHTGNRGISFVLPSEEQIVQYKKQLLNVSGILSNSTRVSESYRQLYKFHGDILAYGFPKESVLNQHNSIIEEKIRRQYGVNNGEKLIVFAPMEREKPYPFKNYELDTNALLDAFSERAILFVYATQCSDIPVSNRVIDVSSHIDVEELLIAADVLITDYSDIITEFGTTGKPAIMYTPDIVDFSKNHSFYPELYEQPFPVATDNEELVETLQMFNQEEYKIDLNTFYKRCGHFKYEQPPYQNENNFI